MTVEPLPEQLQALVKGDLEAPVVMLNLLRFADRAKDVEEDMTGADAYDRYGAEVLPYLERAGGEVVWQGTASPNVIGPPEERWDRVLLVRYPSRRAFLEMVSDPGYREIARWRSAALDDSRLVPLSPPD